MEGCVDQVEMIGSFPGNSDSVSGGDGDSG